MDRFCCNSAAIHSWKFDRWGTIPLTHVAPTNRASFSIHPYINGSKRFLGFLEKIKDFSLLEVISGLGFPFRKSEMYNFLFIKIFFYIYKNYIIKFTIRRAASSQAWNRALAWGIVIRKQWNKYASIISLYCCIYMYVCIYHSRNIFT